MNSSGNNRSWCFQYCDTGMSYALCQSTAHLGHGSLGVYIYVSFTSRVIFSRDVIGICRIRPLPTPCACLACFLPHVELGTYVSGFMSTKSHDNTKSTLSTHAGQYRPTSPIMGACCRMRCCRMIQGAVVSLCPLLPLPAGVIQSDKMEGRTGIMCTLP